MIEQHIFQIIAALLGLILVIIGYFCRLVLSKMDGLHRDLVALTINHGERITRLEAASLRGNT